jgi:hypothetical protein
MRIRVWLKPVNSSTIFDYYLRGIVVGILVAKTGRLG